MRKIAFCAGLASAVLGCVWARTLGGWPVGLVAVLGAVWGVMAFRFALGVDWLLGQKGW